MMSLSDDKQADIIDILTLHTDIWMILFMVSQIYPAELHAMFSVFLALFHILSRVRCGI